jgi:hypothetical protein
MATLPGYKIWSTATPLTTAASPLVTPWFDATGYTQVLVSYFAANSTGTTTLTVEGSLDGTTQDTDFSYGAALTSSATTATTVTILTPYFRLRIVQATANATTTKVFLQARA